MKPKLFFVPALLFLVSALACKSNSSSHLPPDKMSSVLLDVQAAETYSSFVRKDSLHPYKTKNTDSLANYYKSVFAHYHISKEQFDESLIWYSLHPEELDSVYNRIVPILTRMESLDKYK